MADSCKDVLLCVHQDGCGSCGSVGCGSCGSYSGLPRSIRKTIVAGTVSCFAIINITASCSWQICTFLYFYCLFLYQTRQ